MKSADIAGDIRTLPGFTGQPDLRVRKKRRKRRPWYRRKLFMAFAAIVALMIVGMVAGMAYVDRQFTEINKISTPPPIVSGNVFDETASGEITTDPAHQVLAFAESGKMGEFTISSGESTELAAEGSGLEGTSNPAYSASADAPVYPTMGASTPITNSPSQSATFPLQPVQESLGDSMNILLMGVDARPSEAIDVGVRPDSLSVLHLNSATGPCRILSIPRDTRMDLPGYGQTKTNHALAVGGIPYEQLVVEQLLGIEIDHYGLIDFAGIERLVEVVGGITIDNPQAFEHAGVSSKLFAR